MKRMGESQTGISFSDQDLACFDELFSGKSVQWVDDPWKSVMDCNVDQVNDFDSTTSVYFYCFLKISRVLFQVLEIMSSHQSSGSRGKAIATPPPLGDVNCPRCDSPNTKFCYYNNYSLSQPRHFCKACRRYWTKGVALRNVPIGAGGCRKNNKTAKSSSGDSKDLDFRSRMCLGDSADDTGGLLSHTSKFTAQEQNTDFNIAQLHNYPNVEPHWAAILHHEQVAVENKGDESIRELPLQDAGYAMIAEFQSSNFQTEKSPPLQEIIEIEDDVLVLDDSHQLPIVEDSIHKRRLIAGAEKDNSNIHVLDKTCIEETSKEGKSPEKGFSYDILSAHFGKPQDDAAKFFNVSRSTFKRICRGHGIKRWQSNKKLERQSSSKLRRVNDEEPSRTNSYCSSIPPLQDTDVITVKASYNGVAIIFEVLDSSGMVDLEDNVIERLKMERDTFSIKYQDDEGDWVLIACDKDLRKCLKTSRLLKKKTVKMLIDRPINHYAS